MKEETDRQRPCASCESTTYAKTSLWNFATGPQCLCAACVREGWVFTPEGRVTRGSRLALQAALDARQRTQEDE
jgi:hypothetical protein